MQLNHSRDNKNKMFEVVDARDNLEYSEGFVRHALYCCLTREIICMRRIIEFL